MTDSCNGLTTSLPRKLSYSADDLDKSGIDDTKVEQILAKKPRITFNIQELVCSVLKDDSFINKLVPFFILLVAIFFIQLCP
jgi:hypothetical protein